MMSQPIALVGLACVYPDARSPVELWENVLAGRCAFRRLPSERLRIADYWSADRSAEDRTYAAQAAVIEGYEFDRVGFRVAGDSYRAADLAHWLALDVAARALADAGFEQGALLFQGGRFRRLSGYRRLRSTSCVAEIAEAEPAEWFHRYLPPALVLGDPAARDVAIHAIQACIPQATILPIGVDRFTPGVGARTGPHLVRARERSDQGDLLVYDVEIADADGRVRERWEGLRLSVVEHREPGED
jgi:hypothetical protein